MLLYMLVTVVVYRFASQCVQRHLCDRSPRPLLTFYGLTAFAVAVMAPFGVSGAITAFFAAGMVASAFVFQRTSVDYDCR